MRLRNILDDIIKIACVILALFGCAVAYAEDSTIIVYCLQEKGAINKKIYGTNFIGYDPRTFEKDRVRDYYGYSDYGAGIWDSKWNNSVQEPIQLAKECGVTVIRFPGGNGANRYNWKNSIGGKRKHFLYGLDEFLKTTDEIGAEVVFTVAYDVGNERDAADLVEYLNIENNGKNHSDGVDWAAERARNGSNEPYRVKYFEIGNEVWDYEDPREYVKKYEAYYHAMKNVDPNIKIGVILQPDNWKNWNEIVLREIKDDVDFAIPHIYAKPLKPINRDDKLDSNALFLEVLGAGIRRQMTVVDNCLKLIQKYSDKSIPLAVTEYNVGFFADNKLIPYRHSLGAALVNAELVKFFMQPESQVFMANYWQFCNSYWGMVANGFNGEYNTLNRPYYKRPNFYALEFYNKHFGDMLLRNDTKSPVYKNSGYDIPYLSVNASKSTDGKKVYLMVINKNMNNHLTTMIVLRDFVPMPKGEAWVLNGPSVDTTNEKKHDNVKVTQHEFGIKSNRFEFSFEPHSLTAIEIQGRATNAEFSGKAQ